MTTNTNDITTNLNVLRDLVTKLYLIHDTYFPIDPAQKTAKLQEELQPILKLISTLDTSNASSTIKAEIALLHGKALDTLPSYSPLVEELLSKAIKLDSNNYENWNALGHCFWKKRDYPAAIGCYADSQKRHPNTTALQALSKLVRYASQTSESIKESITHAKAAIALNMNDSSSWSTLGAVLLISYIRQSHNADDLIRAHKAYSKAFQLENTVSTSTTNNNSPSNVIVRDPDMHYNRGSVLQYLEDFEEAIIAYRTAVSIDPGLQGNQDIQNIYRYLLRINDLISKHAHIKPKKLRELANSIAVPPSTSSTGSSASTTSIHSPTLLPTELKLIGDRKPSIVKQLKPGENKGFYIRLKLLLPVLKADRPPASAIVLDADNECCVLSLFHLSEKNLYVLGDKDKNTLLILDPILKPISVKVPSMNIDDTKDTNNNSSTTTENNIAASTNTNIITVNYSCIQVMHSDTFFIDGKLISSELAAAASGYSIETFDR